MSVTNKRLRIHLKRTGQYLGTLHGRNAMEFEVWMAHGVGVAVLTPDGVDQVRFSARDSLIGNSGAYPAYSLVTYEG